MTRENLTDFEREFEKQASRYYNYNGPDDLYAIRECCKELMQKAKEEFMKEAVEVGGVAIWQYLDNRGRDFYKVETEEFTTHGEICDGDKVKLIIVKED